MPPRKLKGGAATAATAATPKKNARGRKPGSGAAARKQQTSRFRHELEAHGNVVNADVGALRAVLSAQTASIERGVIEQAQVSCDLLLQSRAARQTLEDALKQHTRDGKVKRIHVKIALDMMGQLDAVVHDTVKSVDNLQQKFLAELELRREQQRQLTRIEEQTLRMRQAVYSQLDQLAEARIQDNAVHPYAVSGIAGRFLRAAMPSMPDKQRRSYTPRLAAMAAQAMAAVSPEDGEAVAAAAAFADAVRDSGTASTSAAEREERVIPPTGFLTDSSARRYFQLLSQKQAFDRQAANTAATGGGGAASGGGGGGTKKRAPKGSKKK